MDVRYEIERRRSYLDRGLLTACVCPINSYVLYNYTIKCAVRAAWDDVTLNSRGLMLDFVNLACVARSISKFFDVADPVHVPWHDCVRAEEKVDGHLGILYRTHDGELRVTTRGHINSPSACWATQHLSRHDLRGLDDKWTLLFEILGPTSRVIVDYHECEALLLLTAINRHTGEEATQSQVDELGERHGFDRPVRHPLHAVPDVQLHVAELLLQANQQRQEGLVLVLCDNTRLKLKTPWYMSRVNQARRARVV